jgi:hypothetical protein
MSAVGYDAGKLVDFVELRVSETSTHQSMHRPFSCLAVRNEKICRVFNETLA